MSDSKQSGCIHEIFEEQVRLTPQAVAIEFGECQMTFTELNSKADQVSARLQKSSVKSGDYVALMVDRSPEMIAAFLGILKCGAACVPLDKSGPAERIRHMISQANVNVLLSSSSISTLNISDEITVLDLESVSSNRSDEETPNSKSGCNVNQPAYVIFTSGSTGLPKGVIGTHSSLLNGLRWIWCSYPFERDEVCCYTRSQLNLIDSMWEIWLPLLRGVRLRILKEEVLRNPRRLVEALREHRITRIAIVPSLLQLLIDSCRSLVQQLPNLRLWMSSGEPLRTDLAERFLTVLPTSRLLNLYGLSEVPDVTYFEVGSAPAPPISIPIGTAIANISLFLLDENKNLVPEGRPGELHVGGPGLAMGYLARPALTAERFIPNGFGNTPGERLYNTGDLAQCRYDGNLEYLGRKDLQVNIHGFRVELGEVEVALSQHPDVAQAVVIARKQPEEANTLAAFLLFETDRIVSGPELRSYLKYKLPYYMIPTEFVSVDSIPFTRSGKVDRLALSKIARRNDSEETVEPRDLLELQIAQIWQDALKVGPISIFDDFFELGGDSLSAISIVCKIEEQLSEKVPLSLISEASTIAGLAAILKENKGPLPFRSLVPIRQTGSRRPLFLVHGIGGEVLEFHDLARHLGPDQPVYALQAPLELESAAEYLSIEEIATSYLEAIREICPEGPYLLAGYSWGGIVAFEIAQQLVRRGQSIQLLAILDTDLEDSLQTDDRITDLASLMKDQEHLLFTTDYLSVLDPDGRFREELERLELGLSQEGITQEFGDAYRRIYARGFITRTKAASAYRPDKFAGKITLVLSSESSFDEQWKTVTTMPLDILAIPATHLGILREPSVQRLAEYLTHRLDPQMKAKREAGHSEITVEEFPELAIEEDAAGSLYKVVVNQEAQYSIWPASRANAWGWDDGGKTGTKEECLSFIDQVWTDIRPLSLRTATQHRD